MDSPEVNQNVGSVGAGWASLEESEEDADGRAEVACLVAVVGRAHLPTHEIGRRVRWGEPRRELA
jgi:hypothetical protein